MDNRAAWLAEIDAQPSIEGIVYVKTYDRNGRPPEEVAIMERAATYGAFAVFFEAAQNGRSPLPQAFIYVSTGGLIDDDQFAKLHKRLWSWGGVPLVYRKLPGLVQLFRCAHQPDFVAKDGTIVCKPFRLLKIGTDIAHSEAWWDVERLQNGTLWDDPSICKMMLSASKSAHKKLIGAVKALNDDLNNEGVLKKHIRRKLLILSLLIAYLEEREVFLPDFFGQFKKGATKFFQILADGKALVALLDQLEERFNGHVFTLEEADRAAILNSTQLPRFARLVEAHEETTGQLTLWQLYSFKDLPVELISHIYQLFVTDASSSVYTPPFLVRLILEEALSWARLDRLQEKGEVILDPSCGSGVFLVEAYKRLVLHWRSRNDWKRPRIPDLKRLLKHVHGIDLELGAIELAAFSLCLALCDALQPEEIRSSIKLFPPLAGKTLHHSCFFEAKEKKLVKDPVGVVVGNPPFESRLSTEGAKRSYDAYVGAAGGLPDKQLAYLFLHEAMQMVAPGGALSMLQQYNFLYNHQSSSFRKRFMSEWNVREILDFISVRGLFHKGGADTKVVVVVADAAPPQNNQKLLHAVFRRTGRADAEQGFDIDYYDLHWVSRAHARTNDAVWRSNLLGGGRVLAFVERLKTLRTLGEFAESQGWDYGEGFIEGGKAPTTAEHLLGKPLLPNEALTTRGIVAEEITTFTKRKVDRARTANRFTPPMVLVKEHMDLPHGFWNHYLTYKAEIVGFAGPKSARPALTQVDQWLTREANALRAYVACTSGRLFTSKATAMSAVDILSLPYPGDEKLDLSPNETALAEDIVGYQRDLVRLGDESDAMTLDGRDALPGYARTFANQVNGIYKDKPLRPAAPQAWPGVICQPFVFGEGAVDWEDTDSLRNRLDKLLVQQSSRSISITRIARIYDGNFIFVLKSDRLRYWLRSIALRDADETLSDLRAQGF